MSRKTRSGEIFRRRSFFGTGVLSGEEAKGGFQNLAYAGGGFLVLVEVCAQKVFPDQFCKISQQLFCISPGYVAGKKVVKLLISTKDGDFWFSTKYGAFYYVGNISPLSEFNHL